MTNAVRTEYTAQNDSPERTNEQLHTAAISRDKAGEALGVALFIDESQLSKAGIDPAQATVVSYTATEQGLQLSTVQG